MTFSSLIKKHKVKHVDLLNIDTEGYDGKIIKTIPFDKIKPKMILYEHNHLSKDEKQQVNSILKKQGYKSFSISIDTFAFL